MAVREIVLVRSYEGPRGRPGRGPGWLLRYRILLGVIDVFAASVAAVAGAVVDPGRPTAVTFAVLVPVLWPAAVMVSRAYEARFLGVGSEEFRRVLIASVTLIALLGTASWGTRLDVARGYVVVALPVATLLSLILRYAARKRLHVLRRRGKHTLKVLVVGHGDAAADLVGVLRRDSHHGLDVVGACVPVGRSYKRLAQAGIPMLGGLDDIPAAVDQVEAEVVAVLSCPEMDGPALRRLSWSLEGTGTDLVVAPTLLDVAGPRIHIRPVCGLPLLHVEAPELTGGRRLVKALVDRTAAACALVLLTPLLLALAVIVKLDTPGPVLFRQRRVGLHGRTFTMLKFRTMVADAEDRLEGLRERNECADGLLFKVRDDPRITRSGHWMRKFSLDELPQFVHVLTGVMSLVGPRPPLVSEVEKYGDDLRRRLRVKPGLTGLWQINGRSDLSWNESVRLDLRYVENWSLPLDFLILWKTAFAVVKGKGAY